MTKITNNRNIKESTSKRNIFKSMQKKSIMALEQLGHQKKGARRASWLWNNWIVRKHKQENHHSLKQLHC
jgi:hypothetical protein